MTLCRMRIVHIVHQFVPENYGGVEMYLFDLARRQRDAGDVVTIITGTMRPAPEVCAVRDEHEGLAIVRIHRADLFFDSWDKGFCPEVAELLRGTLAELRPDVVHLHHWIRLTSNAGEVVRSLGMPLILTIHDLVLSCPRAFRVRVDDTVCFRDLAVASCLDCVPRRPWDDDAGVAESIEMYRASSIAELGQADRVLCATATLRDLLTRAIGIGSERFEILPLAYAPRFTGITRRRDDEIFRFAYWGAITPRKGVGFLIEAFRALVEGGTRRPVALEIFGRADLQHREQELRAQAAGLPVRFHGRYEYSDLAHGGLAVAVFPSRCIETYGIVLDEAFELGIPAVIPNIGAMAERAAGAALEFEINDLASLSGALRRLADSPALAEELARRIPPPPISEREHVLRLREIYGEAIESARAGAPRAPVISADRRQIHLFRTLERHFRRLIEREGEGRP
jgi:glycosyltransferase involved in cell wall biosynthesis